MAGNTEEKKDVQFHRYSDTKITLQALYTSVMIEVAKTVQLSVRTFCWTDTHTD